MANECNCEDKCGCTPSLPPSQPTQPDSPSGNETPWGSSGFSSRPGIMEYMRRQELLSTIDELTDQQINFRPCELPEGGASRDVKIGLGEQIVLKAGGDGSILPYIWENSNPRVLLLQPTQYLDQGHVMALALGNATVRATCSINQNKFYTWNLEVVKEQQFGNGGIVTPPSTPNHPCNPSDPDNPWCDCEGDCGCCKPEDKPTPGEDERTILEILAGGTVNLSPSVLTQLDLKGKSLYLDGVSLDLTLGEKYSIVNEGSVIEAGAGSVLNILGNGKFIGGEGTDGKVLTAHPGSTVTISGCKFTATADALGTGNSCIFSTGGKIIIEDGVFESTTPYSGNYYVLNILDYLIISGGRAIDYIEVRGGKFYNQDPELGDPGHPEAGSFVPSGYVTGVINRPDGTKIFVVRKDDGNLPDLEPTEEGDIEWPDDRIKPELPPPSYEEEVAEDIESGRDVELSEDVTFNKPVSVSGNIDLSGKEMSMEGEGQECISIEPGEVTISNGNITVNYGTYAIYVKTGADLTLDNVNLETVGEFPAIQAKSASFVTIKSGSYKVNGPDEVISSAGGKVVLEGGRFESSEPGPDGKYYTLQVVPRYMTDSSKETDFIEVLGGEFVEFNPMETPIKPENEVKVMKISPISTLSGEEKTLNFVPESHISGWYIEKSTGKKIWTVMENKNLPGQTENGEIINWPKTPEEIGTDLKADIKAGKDVVLSGDAYVPGGSLDITKPVTLDLSGHTLTTEGNGANKDTIRTQGAKITIKNGVINGPEEYTDYTAVIYVLKNSELILEDLKVTGCTPIYVNGDNATVTINSGEYTTPLSSQAVYVNKGTAKVVINGGRFKCASYNGVNYCVNLLDSIISSNPEVDPKNYIEIKGGEFVNFNPGESYTEPSPWKPCSFVAPGYKVESYKEGDDTIYKVVPEN